MRSMRQIPLAAAILSMGLALAAAQESGCASSDGCPESGPPKPGNACIGDEVCRYEDSQCGGEFQCVGGVWIANTTPKPGCEGTGGARGVGGAENTGGFSNTGGTSNPTSAGGNNAGGSNAGGSSAGGSNAGGNASGGSNAGGSPTASGGGGAAASTGTN